MKETLGTGSDCRHHWLLGQPDEGSIAAVCRKCGLQRLYPAVLDDLDPGIETDMRRPHASVATAAGGARPSAVALRQAPDVALRRAPARVAPRGAGRSPQATRLGEVWRQDAALLGSRKS